MLVGRDGRRLRVGDALFWACAWGVGVALGVALGGWLTLVGGSGAPGAEGLDAVSDLVVLPLAAAGATIIVHLLGQVVASAVRGRAVQPSGD